MIARPSTLAVMTIAMRRRIRWCHAGLTATMATALFVLRLLHGPHASDMLAIAFVVFHICGRHSVCAGENTWNSAVPAYASDLYLLTQKVMAVWRWGRASWVRP